MAHKIQALELLATRVGFEIFNHRVVANGIQITLRSTNDLLHLAIYDNGNFLVQGKNSQLKEIIEKWVNKNLQDIVGIYPDFNMSWKEWHHEIPEIQKYIQKNGEPDEKTASHNYKIRREVLFHDYMFRNSSHQNISFEKISMVLKSWSSRFCFMNINVERVLEKVRDSILENYSDTNEKEIPFSIAVDYISNYFSESCHEKFIKVGNCLQCPQVKTESYYCISDIVDALYVYCDDQKVIAYTKKNFKNLMSRNTSDLSWHSLAPSSPIEVAMTDGLRNAGILTLPQFQAYDANHKYRIDNVIKTSSGFSIAVECDGLQYHANATTYMRDRIRDRYLQQRGFFMMRFSSIEIYKNLDKCIEEIDQTFWSMQKGKINFQSQRQLGYFGTLDDED